MHDRLGNVPRDFERHLVTFLGDDRERRVELIMLGEIDRVARVGKDIETGERGVERLAAAEPQTESGYRQSGIPRGNLRARRRRIGAAVGWALATFMNRSESVSIVARLSAVNVRRTVPGARYSYMTEPGSWLSPRPRVWASSCVARVVKSNWSEPIWVGSDPV